MNSKQISTFLTVLCAGLTPCFGQQDTMATRSISFDEITSINEIPEQYRIPVCSTHPGSSVLHGIDTLKTSNPSINMVLYDNYTWAFIKDNDVMIRDSVMTEAWMESKVQPYTLEMKDLPYRTTIWLVDSLERFCCPCNVPVFSKFGLRRGRNHNGVDLPSPKGTPTYATFAGKVRVSMYTKGYGNLIIIRHHNGLETYYGHLSQRDVKPGDWVEAGQQIGLIGSTGRSTGPHLHYEMRYKGFAFDPQWLVDFPKGELRKSIFILKRRFLSIYSKYTPESLDDEENIMLTAEQEKAEEDRIAAERAAMRWHTIKSGDTLSRIAVKNGTTVSAICKLNKGMTPKTTLKLGRKIRVR